MKKLLPLLFVILTTTLSRAQIEISCYNLSWDRMEMEASYSATGSLATAKVSNIVQDKDGYLWLGTLSGLFRYDG